MSTPDLQAETGNGASEVMAHHGPAAGVTHHGATEPRGLTAVPQSPLFEGLFGRMFRTLTPLAVSNDDVLALIALMEDRTAPAAGDNPGIPSGYTYLGQFVDHDITFDPTSQLGRLNDPDALVDFRTPRFDLDSLYGSGPAADPFLYEWSNKQNRGIKLLVGRNPTDTGEFERDDLPRNQQARALIGDPRNDENLIVSQLHLLFIRFHNRVVDRVRNRKKLEGAELLKEAQRVVRWHYQWIVVHDFLHRIAGKAMAESVLTPDPGGGAPTVHRSFYDWVNQPFMPVEFSGAAYRFGHSMVRPSYDLNAVIQDIPLFVTDPNPDPLSHLGGFRRLPAAWSVDWSFFFKTASRKPQLARKIDTKLSEPLFKLPPGVDPKRHALAGLNLRRGSALGLPSGQDVAGAMGVPALTAAELGLGALAAHLQTATPLWFYMLRESEVKATGARLGPVAGRIVAEVLVGLLQGDPLSYLSVRPAWTPTLPSAQAGDFTMADLVKFALS
jgi:hypothetical protein